MSWNLFEKKLQAFVHLDQDAVDDMDVAVFGLHITLCDVDNLAAWQKEADDATGVGNENLLVVQCLEPEPVNQVLRLIFDIHDMVVNQLGELRIVLEEGVLIFSLHFAEGILVRSEDCVQLVLCWKESML